MEEKLEEKKETSNWRMMLNIVLLCGIPTLLVWLLKKVLGW